MQGLDREASQLWTALRWTIERNETTIGLRLASALSGYLQVRSSLSEGRNWLEEILALHEVEGSTVLRAKVLYGAGVVAFRRNNLVLAHKRL